MAVNFGYPRFHPQTARGYYQKVCVMPDCGRVALYHCGGNGFCKIHKGEAIKRHKYINATVREPRHAAIEEHGREFDADQLKHISSQRTQKFGRR